MGCQREGALQSRRRNREDAPKNPNRQAEALLTYAVKAGLITAEERQLIALTTVTRYLPNVRTALALLNTEDCTTNARPEEFNLALQRFLKDTKDPPALPEQQRQCTRAPIQRLATHMRRRFGAKVYRRLIGIGHLRSIDDTSYQPSNEKSPPKSLPHPSKRKQLIPSSFCVAVRDNVLLRLVAEGKALNPDDALFSCNYLNRVILERIVHLYATRHGVEPTRGFCRCRSACNRSRWDVGSPANKGHRECSKQDRGQALALFLRDHEQPGSRRLCPVWCRQSRQLGDATTGTIVFWPD